MTLVYASVLHLLAGTVAGSVFKVRTLLLLLAFVIVETILLGMVRGNIDVLWAVANLVSLQVGYFGGGLGRLTFIQSHGSISSRAEGNR